MTLLEQRIVICDTKSKSNRGKTDIFCVDGKVLHLKGYHPPNKKTIHKMGEFSNLNHVSDKGFILRIYKELLHSVFKIQHKNMQRSEQHIFNVLLKTISIKR